MRPPVNIAVLIYPGVELVDMNGPIDVFSHANRFKPSPYNIYTVAADAGNVTSEAKIVTIVPQYTIANCPTPDIVVIPGIVNDDNSTGIAAPAIISWIKEMVERKTIILSVCIGIYNLAATGLLSGKKVTTHYLAIDDFHQQYKNVTIIKNVRFVEDGDIVTTGGVTSGIDGALHLVEKYDGPSLAQHVADILVYNRDAPLPPYTILPPYYS